MREWTLHEELGRGGMGIIYRATHDLLEGDFALKQIHPKWIGDEDVARRFVKEAALATQLKHPHIVRGEIPFVEGEQVYLPMERLRGLPLSERRGAQPWPWAVEVIRQAAAALSYTHTLPQPVIHRDLKPSNLFLSDEGDPCVKLLDFGLARRVGEASMTAPMAFVGSLKYVAPEVFAGEKAGPPADIYALGVILHQLLTGEPLVALPDGEGSSPAVVMYQLSQAHLRGFEPPSASGAAAPLWVDQLVARMLAIDPEARPRDGAALQALLEAGREDNEGSESALRLEAYAPQEASAPRPAPSLEKPEAPARPIDALDGGETEEELKLKRQIAAARHTSNTRRQKRERREALELELHRVKVEERGGWAAVRKAHLWRERIVHDLGRALILFAILNATLGPLLLHRAGQGDDIFATLLASAALVYIGRGLTRLQRLPRWLAGVIGGGLLPLSGFSAAVGGYILFTLFFKKSWMVFSKRYRYVREHTPEIHPLSNLYTALHLVAWLFAVFVVFAHVYREYYVDFGPLDTLIYGYERGPRG